MIPREPPRRPQLGFLYVPPLRIQGLSIAGEYTAIAVPEMDVCFDIGICPRAVLASKYVALSHTHMDHSAALAYYFSQRHFQGMDPGTIICPKAMEQPIHALMRAWVNVEAQRTPYNLIGLDPEGEIEVKNNIFLRGIPTVHTVPSLGYILLERRSKLREELVGLPQEKLVELKRQGQEITRMLEIPLVAYTGDTARGPFFERDDFRKAKVIISECTFLEPDHRDRAAVGKHLHLDDICDMLESCQAEAIVLTHLSRRTHIGQVRGYLQRGIPARHRDRVLVLMDGRTNRLRYERQLADAGGQQAPAEAEPAGDTD